MALLALTIDERTIILSALEDPPEGVAELRAVLLNELEWRQRTGLDLPRSNVSPGGSESAAETPRSDQTEMSGGRAVGVNLSS